MLIGCIIYSVHVNEKTPGPFNLNGFKAKNADKQMNCLCKVYILLQIRNAGFIKRFNFQSIGATF